MRKPEIFSDFVNGALFRGEQVITPEMLTLLSRETILKISGKRKKEKEGVLLYGTRDVVFQADMGKNGDIIFQMILGLENQSFVDYGMVIRNMVYDAAAYGKQLKTLQRKNRAEKSLRSGDEFLSGIHADDRFMPVITLTFYYGETQWDGKLSLHEILEIPKEQKWLYNYISNYRIHLIHAGNVKPEYFKTGLRQVFSLMRYADDGNAMEKYLLEHEREYTNVSEETLELLLAFFSEKDMELITMKENYRSIEGGYDMCTAFRQMQERGIQIGEERGIQIGEERGEYGKLIKQIKKKLDKGQNAQQMAEALEEEPDMISRIIDLIQEADRMGEDIQYIIQRLSEPQL